MTTQLIQNNLKRAYGIYYQSPQGTETNDVYLGWTNSGYCQVRYRTRHRLMYDGQDVETFDTWSAWTELYTTGPTSSTKMAGLNAYATKLPHTASDFTGSYDQLVYQVQVRSCASDGSNPGAWETTDLPVDYFPEWTVEGMELDAETLAMDLEVDPGIARPVSMFAINDVWDSNGEEAVPPGRVKLDMHHFAFSSFDYDDSGHIHLYIPAELANYIPRSDGTDGAEISCRMVTSDGVGAYRRRTYTVTVKNQSAYLADPDPTFTETGTGLAVSVPHETASGSMVEYESCTVAYSWTDARGAETAGSTVLVKDGAAWVGEIPSPPFGATVTAVVTVTGTKSGAKVYKSVTATHTMDPCGWFVLTHGQELTWLGYELAMSRNKENAVETIQLASGRTIARHGLGSTGKISLSGTILDAARRGPISSIWLPDAEVLAEPHDWVLRTPEGERYTVTVVDWSLSASRAGIQDMSIGMEEVG